MTVPELSDGPSHAVIGSARNEEAFVPRRLTDWMLDQFASADGLLHPLLLEVQEDPDLDLQIRDHYVNIYYHGSNLMEIRQSGRTAERLTTKFDEKYLPEFADHLGYRRPRSPRSTNG